MKINERVTTLTDEQFEARCKVREEIADLYKAEADQLREFIAGSIRHVADHPSGLGLDRLEEISTEVRTFLFALNSANNMRRRVYASIAAEKQYRASFGL